MEDILAQATRVAEAAEVFLVSIDETSVQFENNRLKHIHSRQSSTLALRVIHQGRIGYAVSTELGDRPELVTMALETARFGTPARFDFPQRHTYPAIKVFDPDTVALPLENMIELGAGLIAPITTHTPEILCEAAVSKSVISISIVNSQGGEASYRKSVFSAGIDGNLIRGTDMLFVGDSQSSCHPIADPTLIAGMVLHQLDLARKQAPVTSGTMPVIFTPDGVASALVAPLMAAFNGKTVLEGASPIGSRLGEKVFADRLSLWDDPSVVCRPASRPCDDEGIPSQRTPLIEEGKVAHFLYDLQTAALAGTQSTGSGSRSRSGLPTPSPTAFVIAPGSTTFDDMVKDIKEGLVIEQLMGAGQGNVLGGDFSGNVLLGYKVQNGEITGRVKDTMVSGNIYQLLKDIAAIGIEAKWVGGFLHTPHLYFPSLAVASK